MSTEVTPAQPPRRVFRVWTVVLGVVVLIGAGAYLADVYRDRTANREGGVDVAAAPADGPRHPVLIRKPEGRPVVKTGLTDHAGLPADVACATCHATREPNPAARLGADLKLFHQGLHGQHGCLSCNACHNPTAGYATLRLADGRSLPYSEAMQLCAQCHGPQYRDYLNGAHGGMTGYWDLTKGGRSRNTCTDCHDPHAPRYPTVRPAPGPRDRNPSKETGHE